MRVFVCGGRTSSDGDRVFRTLDALHTRRGFTALIEDERDEGRPPAEGNFNAGKEAIHTPRRWRLKLRRKIDSQPANDGQSAADHRELLSREITKIFAHLFGEG